MIGSGDEEAAREPTKHTPDRQAVERVVIIISQFKSRSLCRCFDETLDFLVSRALYDSLYIIPYLAYTSSSSSPLLIHSSSLAAYEILLFRLLFFKPSNRFRKNTSERRMVKNTQNIVEREPADVFFINIEAHSGAHVKFFHIKWNHSNSTFHVAAPLESTYYLIIVTMLVK